jgi:outer membrane protein assembly factor BamB
MTSRRRSRTRRAVLATALGASAGCLRLSESTESGETGGRDDEGPTSRRNDSIATDQTASTDESVETTSPADDIRVELDERWVVPDASVLDFTGDSIFVTGDDKETVAALHPETGEVMWRAQLGETVRGLQPDSSNGRVYVSGGVTITEGKRWRGYLTAIDDAGGNQLNRNTADAAFYGGVSLTDETAICLGYQNRTPENSGANLPIFGYETQTFERRWRTDFEGLGRPQGAVTQGDRAYCAFSNNFCGVRLSDGTIDFYADWSVSGTPQAADGDVYVSVRYPDRGLVRLDPDSNVEIWSAGTAVETGPAVGEGVAVVGSEDGVYCIETGDGSVRWSATEIIEPITDRPTITGRYVWALSQRANHLYCIALDSGELVFDRSIESYPRKVRGREDTLFLQTVSKLVGYSISAVSK